MTVEVGLAGRPRTVTIERGSVPGRFRVTVDGHAHELDVSRPGEFAVSLRGTFPGGRRTVATLHVVPVGVRGELLVHYDGRTKAAVLDGRRAERGTDAGASGQGEVAVAAPMPGRVVRVLVAPGDEVAARQGLIVVEAMKMENELRAPRAGRVREVSVSPGTSVEAGRVLAIIE